MQLTTRFTERFAVRHPLVLAPMAGAAGAELAAAVSTAGGLGLLGGGYGDLGWLDAEWSKLRGADVGIGFITWRLTPAILAHALALRPKAMFLSFGDPRPYALAIKAAGVPLICQCQSLAHAQAAIEAGADVIVAQGAEAGGHGAGRATFTLVPELADYIAGHAPQTLLLAAGGIADGRGLAAAMMLGAEGAVIGTRFWAASEALVPRGFHDAAIKANGDQSLRSRLPDFARDLDWPADFTIRTLTSEFSRDWQDRADALRDPAQASARAAWVKAQAAGDAKAGSPVAGEAVGLIREILPAGRIIDTIMTEARACLARHATA